MNEVEGTSDAIRVVSKAQYNGAKKRAMKKILTEGVIEEEAEDAATRYLYHHLFRYVLKAVNDDALLPRVRAGVMGAVMIRRLISAGVDPITAVYRYSREIEHNEENFARVMAL